MAVDTDDNEEEEDVNEKADDIDYNFPMFSSTHGASNMPSLESVISTTSGYDNIIGPTLPKDNESSAMQSSSRLADRRNVSFSDTILARTFNTDSPPISRKRQRSIAFTYSNNNHYHNHHAGSGKFHNLVLTVMNNEEARVQLSRAKNEDHDDDGIGGDLHSKRNMNKSWSGPLTKRQRGLEQEQGPPPQPPLQLQQQSLKSILKRTVTNSLTTVVDLDLSSSVTKRKPKESVRDRFSRLVKQMSSLSTK